MKRAYRCVVSLLYGIIASSSAYADDYLQYVLFAEHKPAMPSATDAVARSIGVIEGHRGMFGTAFLVAPCMIVTSRHVVAGKDGFIDPFASRRFWIGEPQSDGGSLHHFDNRAEATLLSWGGAPSFKLQASDPIGTDWALLRLSECLGSPAFPYGYLELWPLSTRQLILNGSSLPATLYGFPDKTSFTELWADAECHVLGPITDSGWDNDCASLPGMSGGPLVAIDPSDGKAKVIAVNRGGYARYVDRASPPPLRRTNRRSRSYLNSLSYATPIFAAAHQISTYLGAEGNSLASATCDRDCDYECLGDRDLLSDLNAAIQSHGGTPLLHYWRGSVYYAWRQLDDAKEDVAKALALDPYYGPALELSDTIERAEPGRHGDDLREYSGVSASISCPSVIDGE